MLPSAINAVAPTSAVFEADADVLEGRRTTGRVGSRGTDGNSWDSEGNLGDRYPETE